MALFLRQGKNGYRYNTDSILLYHFVARRRLNGLLLDVGCGCGVIGLLLARDYGVALTGVDIQEDMIAFCKENSQLNNIEADFHAADFRLFNSEKKFNTIVCNPPFYHASTTASANQSLKIARYANALPIDDFLKHSGKLLDSKGDLFFCYDAAYIYELTHILRDRKYRLKTLQFVYKNPSASARLALLHAKKTAISTTTILPPIITRDCAKEIAKKADTLCVA
ncbi:MAG: methyltransferase [Helicobacteraceae bacterium]|jgi:tRNA1(Val) A37 N6-methylase TrmN6|nr:methyltransferase [Helicobacteraceae bacterium]